MIYLVSVASDGDGFRKVSKWAEDRGLVFSTYNEPVEVVVIANSAEEARELVASQEGYNYDDQPWFRDPDVSTVEQIIDDGVVRVVCVNQGTG